jgi:hypothetical protein
MHLIQVDEVLVAIIRHSLTQFFYKLGILSNSDYSSASLKQIVTLKIGTLRSLETSDEIYCSTRWNNPRARNPSNTQSTQSKRLEFFVQINFLGSSASLVG